MPDIPDKLAPAKLAPLPVRLAWFFGIALASALAVGAAAELLHLFIRPHA